LPGVSARALGTSVVEQLSHVATLEAQLVWFLAAAALVGYAPAWISHLAYEGNRPTTFQHPAWSLLADLKMGWLWATGRLDTQLAVAGIGVSPQGDVRAKKLKPS
jgi:hypothetical protein